MPWYFYIALSKVFDTFTTLQARKIFTTRKINAVSFTILNSIICGIIIFIYGIFQPDFGLLPGQSIPWVNLLLMTLLYGFGSVFYYSAVERVEASKIAILSTFGTLAGLLSGRFLLNEILTSSQIIGGIIIVLGIIVPNIQGRKFVFGKGELFCLIGSACFGAQTPNDKVLMGSFGVNFYLMLAYFLPVIMLFIFYFKSAKKVIPTAKTYGYFNTFLFTLMFSLQALLFFIGLNISDKASLVILLNLAGRILTVVLSVLILKETKHLWQKVLGTVIVIIGLYIVG